jgi:hypothetical protein
LTRSLGATTYSGTPMLLAQKIWRLCPREYCDCESEEFFLGHFEEIDNL